MTTDRAIFDQAVAKNAVPEGTKAAAKAERAPETPAAKPQVKPEEIWREGQLAKDRAAARLEAQPKKEPEAESVPRGTPEVADDDDDTEDPDFVRAKEALRADGFRKKHFEVMDRDEILKKGLKAIKVREANAEAHRIAKEARAAAKSEKSATDSQPSARKPLDLSPVITPLAKSLALDDEGASILKQSLEQFAGLVSEQTAAPLREKLSEFEKQQASQAEANEARVIQVAQAEVGKRFPDLLDPETFTEVLDEVRVLANSKKYLRIANPQERVNLCFQDACQRLELKEEESDGQSRAAEKEQRSRSRSTVSDRNRPTAVTARDMDRERFDAIAAKHGL